MPDLYKGKIPIVYRDLNEGWLRNAPYREPSRGAVPRDFRKQPVAMGDSPAEMRTYSDSEWDALYDAGEENEDSLEHILLRGIESGKFEHLDQDGFPDCWYHSTAHAAMVDALKQGAPVPRLNAVAGATLLNQLNGGWSGLSMKHMREHGCPTVCDDAPYQSRRVRRTAALAANMAQHRVLEDWYDLGRPEYDQQLTRAQFTTCLFDNLPTPSDYNRYAHAMLSIRWVRIEPGLWGPLTLNSWAQFGYHGLCVLAGHVPDGSCALRSGTA